MQKGHVLFSCAIFHHMVSIHASDSHPFGDDTARAHLSSVTPTGVGTTISVFLSSHMGPTVSEESGQVVCLEILQLTVATWWGSV